MVYEGKSQSEMDDMDDGYPYDFQNHLILPSGNLLHSYRTSPFFNFGEKSPCFFFLGNLHIYFPTIVSRIFRKKYGDPNVLGLVKMGNHL